MPRALLALLAGCGISDHRLLRDLQPDEVVKLCSESPETTYACQQQSTTLGGESCVADFDVGHACAATVGDWRACDEARRAELDANPCGTDAPPACAWKGDCASTTLSL